MPNRNKDRENKVPSRWRQWLGVCMVGLFVVMSVLVASISHRMATLEPLIGSAVAQEHDHANLASMTAFSPLLDGSAQPELIPDEIAILALLGTLRVPPNPDSVALERLKSRINRASLSNADMEILARVLGRLDTQAKSQEARIEAFRPTSTASRAAVDRYIEEREVLNALFVEHYQQLLASLSPEGAAKLQTHLLHVKSRIKVFPTPDMSAGN